MVSSCPKHPMECPVSCAAPLVPVRKSRVYIAQHQVAVGVCSAGRTTLLKSPTLFDAFFLARLLHIVSEVNSLFEKWNKSVYHRISSDNLVMTKFECLNIKCRLCDTCQDKFLMVAEEIICHTHVNMVG